MVAFKQVQLTGLTVANPTSLQIGPDNKLYVAQDNGVIIAATVAVDSGGNYTVTSKETISLVRFIPNHNDDGTFNAALGTRQVTGLLVTGTADNPVIYVSSSDPRIGGGTSKGDTGLDTNSGTLSKLSKDASGNWVKVDLVYGLPRSEENHAVNGLQLDPTTGHILLAVGGGTNAGAPSQEFGYLSEYAYAASVVDIDVAAIEAMPSKTYRGQTYKYVLPTVDDPTRSAPGDVVAAGQPEVFGGNNGLNQARLTPDSPVQLYATGFRNLYDIVLTDNGQLYGIDNGGNPSWGGPPLYRQADGTIGTTPTADIVNVPNDGSGSINKAPLHLITPGYYGGHANPTLANPTGAGLYLPDGTPVTLPSDWPPVPAGMSQPVAGYYLPPGANRADLLPAALQNALYLRGELTFFSGSVNGIDDYQGTAFGGAMQGDLIAASLNDDSIYRIDLSPDGKTVIGVTNLTPGGVLGNGAALDVHAAPQGSPFAGTIWVGSYSGGITILVPDESGGGDGVSNDVDNDGLNNAIDPFGVDPTNGQSVVLEGGSTLTWTFSQNEPHPGPGGIGNLGFTGVMTNGQESFQLQYDANKTIMGGAAAGVLMQDIADGTPMANNQTDAFQFGVEIGSDVGSFVIKTKVNSPFDNTVPTDNQSVGFFIGTGDQANYIKIVAGSATVDGVPNQPVIDILVENNDVIVSHQVISAPVFGGDYPETSASDGFVLELRVDPIAGTVTPAWSIVRGSTPDSIGTTITGEGEAVTVTGSLLAAIRGNYTINSASGPVASGLAVGIIGTSDGPGAPFSTTWNQISITSTPKPDAGAGAALLTFTPGGSLDVSTYQADTVRIDNLITSGKDLKQVVIDLDHAVLPDGAFFDPNAAGGDNGKAFQLNTVVGSLTAKATYQNGSASTGYKQITIDFTDFNPGERASFSFDIDPNSLLGFTQTVTPGGVSGAELAGAKVTYVFADGSTAQGDLFGSGIAQAESRGVTNPHSAPVVSLQSQTSGNVAFPAADPSITVTGTPGSTVRVQMMTTAMLSVSSDDPFDGNSATDITYETIVLDASGKGTVSATLSLGRVLVVVAAEVNEQGYAISAVSEPLRIIEQTDPVSSVIGTDVGERLDGSSENDGIDGRGGDDQLFGFEGDDLLNGGVGNDTATGGTGDDTYVVDSTGDIVVELAGEGTDTVRTTLSSYTLGANVENLIYTGTSNFTGTGNALANVLTGSLAADRLDGQAGADVMRGGGGSDTYVVDNVADVVIESQNQGNDRVLSRVSYTLSDNVETLQLTTTKAINASGNAGANTLIGNAGANVLDGRGGADTLTGGDGNDTFQMQRGEANGDVVTDFTGAGVAGGDVLYLVGYGAGATITQVGATDSYVIKAGPAFGGVTETIRLVGVTNLTSGDYVFITPPNAAPTDIVLTNQVIAENLASGTTVGFLSTVDATPNEEFTYSLIGDADGKFALIGTQLVTTSSLDREVQSSYDIVIQVIDGGGNVLERTLTIDVTDTNDNAPTISSAASFTIEEKQSQVVSIQASDPDLVGTPLSYAIKAGEGDAGYFQIVEGNKLAFVAPADFEDPHGPEYSVTIQVSDGLHVTEQVITVTVTDIDESVVNSAPTDILLSAATVAENAAGATIVGVLSTIDPDIGDVATFELTDDAGGRFALSGSDLVVAGPIDFEATPSLQVKVRATDSVGHQIEKTLTISVSDTVSGDEKVLTSANDSFTYQTGLSFDRIDGAGGTDELIATGTAVTLAGTGDFVSLDLDSNGAADFLARSVEKITLSATSLVVGSSLAGTGLASGVLAVTGNSNANTFDGSLAGVKLNLVGAAGNDILKGGSASDILNGGTGNDAMTGGAGDDFYYVDSTSDSVTEDLNGGIDTVSTMLTSYTLGSNVDNLVFGGTKAFKGTGNALANTLTGGAGADRLDGLAGADTMAGLGGNDTYVVDDINDVVIEAAGLGADRVLSKVTYTLSDNTETLQLTSSKAVNGTGNALANTLIGNSAANVLDGRGGADILTGGSGNDTFTFRQGEASGDVVTDFTGAGVAGGDVLTFSGYGAGATLTHAAGSDIYVIHGGAGHIGETETIQITGVTNLVAGDYLFV
ncbi:cadherin domain-containing protein [Novosphingobium cyanobacteriorum]|uniref:Cadherin domain-containing protein n=1 Tax=Novosphingobium cyanobacteriorum TaxID=3024215 RepID=A0ABT6CM56_9SPHN|nr:cadherin domain-containing protein [Novosphingobium cyanobacteriorum]MDF8335002.1 cadherin domain-containing protein [Novosphingobium cyanobacteriorum]